MVRFNKAPLAVSAMPPAVFPSALLSAFLGALFAVFSLAGVDATLAQEAVFDSAEFWAANPSNFGSEAAWREGARWKYEDGATVAYHDGSVYGFAQRAVPKDSDAYVQRRLEMSLAKRADMLAIHAAWVFGFNRLECQAKANYDSLAPDLDKCKNLEVLGNISGEWSGTGFGIAKFSSDSICACRKALDDNDSNRDCNIFFGPIARQELAALDRQSRGGELVEFFRRHHRKNIFGPAQFATVIRTLVDKGQKEDALVILKVAGQKFESHLDTGQWETFGDYYLALGQGDLAQAAFKKAMDTLYLDKPYIFEESCAKN